MDGMQWMPIPALRAPADTQLAGLGTVELLQRPTLALLSSAKAPAGILLAVQDLAQHWRRAGPVIMSGFQSPVENEALTVLLRGPQPLVIWLARGPLAKLPAPYERPLAEGRLLLVTPFGYDVRRITAETALVRNRLAALAADAVLVAHAEPGSKTYTLAQELLALHKQVYTLPHPANQELLQAAAEVYPHFQEA